VTDSHRVKLAAATFATPDAFRQALLRIDPRSRDDWANQVLGLGDLPDDEDTLPSGCVPYLPSSVDVLLRTVERAAITPEDMFVDVGSGVGRAMVLVHLLTGAGAVGMEIQAGLARQANAVAERLCLPRVRTIHGDAEDLIQYMKVGSVFFFYCPFSGERLSRVMDAIRPLARVRSLRLCFVDMPVPDVPWLVEEPAPASGGEAISVCTTRIHTET
jgi:hypothetical protein